MFLQYHQKFLLEPAFAMMLFLDLFSRPFGTYANPECGPGVETAGLLPDVPDGTTGTFRQRRRINLFADPKQIG